jgi:hypothetical protein
VPDFVAIIAGFEARSIFGLGLVRPEAVPARARLRVVWSIAIDYFDIFALLGNRFQGFGSKSSTSPFEGQVLETGTG